ncbi:hypothetical protein CKO15_05510 [Halorhodospira abdelmalekii]|uniref:GGDEF domain-containing protein n=1 Tax=Halorhodospira abdelmalekii TaxID=421629 RepID=UPI00190601D8|nr:GGDEF domain-containing protein [Halorhodospira abdelmalekii]MBK1734753.1 hypothetical protein [Halorhodospira abdelmalekii]
MVWLTRLFGSTWLLHAGLIGLAIIWLLLDAPFPEGFAETLAAHNRGLALTVGLLAAVLALLYQSANTALQAGVLVAFYLWILGSAEPEAALATAAILLPINLLILSLLEERGLLGPPGLVRLGVLLLQGLVIAAIEGQRPQLLEALSGQSFLPKTLSAWTAIPDQGLVMLILATLILAALCLVERLPMLFGALSALLCSTFALHVMANEPHAAAGTALLLLALIGLLIATLQEVHRLAFRDALTGLPNRRALDALLQRLGNRYAIAMMDVDHFKKFNDTYGHEVGDQVLRRVAQTIGQVRAGGRPFRYGGEEFSVIFPGRDAKSVLEVLDELRQEIADTPFRVRDPDRPEDHEKGVNRRKEPSDKGKAVQITISIGVAEPSSVQDDPNDVIQAADQALYRAKKAGRNRVAE